jgi:hypothetical protein
MNSARTRHEGDGPRHRRAFPDGVSVSYTRVRTLLGVLPTAHSQSYVSRARLPCCRRPREANAEKASRTLSSVGSLGRVGNLPLPGRAGHNPLNGNRGQGGGRAANVRMAPRRRAGRHRLRRVAETGGYPGLPVRKPPKEAMRGHRLYVIGWQEAGPVKIGYASDMRVRRNTIQTAFPFPLVVYHETGPVRNARAAEAIAHLLLRDKALLGEWFDVDAARGREVLGQALERAAIEAGVGQEQGQNGATAVRRSIVKAARRRVRGRASRATLPP